MKNFTRGYFTTMRILDLIAGILFCISLAGLILGVPLIISSIKFKNFRKMTDEELVSAKGKVLGWGIFNMIIFAPTILGFLIMLIIVVAVNNYISNLQKGDHAKADRSFGETIKYGAKNLVQGTKDVIGIKSNSEKLKKNIDELKMLKEQGIITEEEFNKKRSELISEF